MNLWEAAILGLVQGLCEFLPVSSSGHLVLLQKIFGIEEGLLFFNSMLHLGTLFAVFAVFYKPIWALLKKPLQKKVYLLVCATAVTTALALLFEEEIDALFGGGLLGVGFLMTSLILLLSERFARGKKRAEDLSYPGAAAVGLIQAVAIMPGVSRSGSTIAASRFFGLSKDEAAEFSFLLSIPPILGSVLLECLDLAKEGVGVVEPLHVAVGMLFAAASGYLAIRWMLKLIREKSLWGFALYTGLLGLFVLLDQHVLHIFM